MSVFEFPKEGCVPFVTRTDRENGIDGYALLEGQRVEEGNCISIGDTTATVFYQKDSFIAGDHIVVCRANWLDLYTGLFIKTLLEKERYRYSYGRAFTMDNIKKTLVRLPIEQTGKPDWERIRAFIKSFPYCDHLV